MFKILISVEIALISISLMFYKKNKIKEELYIMMLGSTVILFVISLSVLPRHPEMSSLNLFSGILIAILFFTIGGKAPINKWKTIYKKYSAYLYGDIKEVKDLTSFISVHNIIYSYLKVNCLILISGAIIAVLLIICWSLIERWLSAV